MTATIRQRITSSVTRRYPFLSGCGTFANSPLVRTAAGAGAGLAWANLNSGAKVLVPLDDFVGRAAYFVGDLDRKISKIIRRLVSPGDHVLDIGANLGVVTLQLAQCVGKDGMVHSFEPNPSVAELLARSIEKNHLRNVRLHTCALGAEEGNLNLSFPAHNAGQGTLAKTQPPAGWRSVQVPVRTLSDLAKEQGIDKVRLIKIDVEGYELDVLRGADQWLTTHRPDALIFESNQAHDNHKPDPVLGFLSERDYALYSMPKQLFFLKLTPYRLDNIHAATSHDMLAIRKECERDIISKFTVST